MFNFLEIVGILVLSVVAIVIFLIVKEIWHSLSPDVQDERMREKFGDNYKELIKDGKLSSIVAAPCRPDDNYIDHDRICEKLGIQLPYFRVVNCVGTLSDFTGDYSEVARIEFVRELTEEELTIIKANGSMHSPYKGDNENECWWNISMTNHKEGAISYGRL